MIMMFKMNIITVEAINMSFQDIVIVGDVVVNTSKITAMNK